jgi:hypothetical protein
VSEPFGALRRLLQQRPQAPEGERCDLCGAALEEEHGHVVNVETRRLSCTCRPCRLLFESRGAAGGKLRAVPTRYRRLSGPVLDDVALERLQVPVRTAFFLRSSAAGRFVAFYPSPAGATESQLALDAWAEIEAQNPFLGELEADVEALLVHGRRGEPLEAYVVPIDACYELVGKVRRSWRGFDGGDEARGELDAFFVTVRERAGEAVAP